MSEYLGLKLSDDIDFYIEGALDAIRFTKGQHNFRFEKDTFPEIVNFFSCHLKDPTNNEQRRKVRCISDCLLSYGNGHLLIESHVDGSLKLSSEQIASLLKYVSDSASHFLRFMSLEDFVFTNNLITLAVNESDSLDCRSLNFLIQIFHGFNAYTKEFLTIVLESSEMETDEPFLAEAYNFTIQNQHKLILMIFASRHAFFSKPLI